jgi:hypothetical protein
MDEQSKTRVDAIERLEGAREEQRQRAAEHDAARGSAEELSAQANLQTAGEHFAAREAWVQWTERDY